MHLGDAGLGDLSVDDRQRFRSRIEDPSISHAAHLGPDGDMLFSSSMRGRPAEREPTDHSTAPVDASLEIEGIETYIRKVGQGAFATVYLCDVAGLDKPAAVKIFTGAIARGAVAQREMAIVSSVNHPNVVGYLGSLGNPLRALIFDYCPGGTVDDLVHGSTRSWFCSLSLGTRVAPMRDIASALELLHFRGLMHRDIKPSNVLISEVVDTSSADIPTAKLSDFGLAREVIQQSVPIHSVAVGSTRYMAPEVMDSAEYSFPADIYSSGIMLFELATGNKPYGDKPLPATYVVRIMGGLRPKTDDIQDDTIGPTIKELLPFCWAMEPADRITAAELAAQLREPT